MELATNLKSILPNPTPNTVSTTLCIRHRELMTQPEADSSSTTPTAKVHASKPSAYSPNLSPHPSPLRPHCLARDRLRLWKPSPAVLSHHSTTQEDDIDKIFNVMSNTWVASTQESYSAGILVYHVYCDSKTIPEELWAPTCQQIVTAFITSLAGSYSASIISHYVHDICAWHILHGLEWRLNILEMDAILKGAQ